MTRPRRSPLLKARLTGFGLRHWPVPADPVACCSPLERIALASDRDLSLVQRIAALPVQGGALVLESRPAEDAARIALLGVALEDSPCLPLSGPDLTPPDGDPLARAWDQGRLPLQQAGPRGMLLAAACLQDPPLPVLERLGQVLEHARHHGEGLRLALAGGPDLVHRLGTIPSFEGLPRLIVPALPAADGGLLLDRLLQRAALPGSTPQTLLPSRSRALLLAQAAGSVTALMQALDEALERALMARDQGPILPEHCAAA